MITAALLTVVILIALPFMTNALLNPPGKVVLDETVTTDHRHSFFYVADNESERIRVIIAVISGPNLTRLHVTKHVYRSFWNTTLNRYNFSYFSEEMTLFWIGQYAFDIDVSALTTIHIKVLKL